MAEASKILVEGRDGERATFGRGFVESRRKGLREGGDLLRHNSLDEVHSDDEVGLVESSSILGVGEVPGERRKEEEGQLEGRTWSSTKDERSEKHEPDSTELVAGKLALEEDARSLVA